MESQGALLGCAVPVASGASVQGAFDVSLGASARGTDREDGAGARPSICGCTTSATATWAALGATVSPPQAMPAHGVTACFVGEQLELLEPLGAESPIAAFLARHPAGGLHHVCHEVHDVQTAARDLESRGYRILAPPALGAHGVPVVFLHPKETHGTLLELQEGGVG